MDFLKIINESVKSYKDGYRKAQQPGWYRTMVSVILYFIVAYFFQEWTKIPLLDWTIGVIKWFFHILHKLIRFFYRVVEPLITLTGACLEDVFKFSVLVNEMDKVEVEIPQTLRHKVGSKYVGNMERFEFGFHFFEIVERDYPELHNLILQSIDRQLWLNVSYIYYSICSDWFEDKT